MDPCPFVRITISNFALKFPINSRSNRIHASPFPCYCEIKLKTFPRQTVTVPVLHTENESPRGSSQSLAATFHLNKSDLIKLNGKSLFGRKLYLKIAVYTGVRGNHFGVNSGKLIGKIAVPVDLSSAEARVLVFHDGWISIGGEDKVDSSQFHVNVTAEPDPRFVFEFEDEPECSPQVFQIQGSIRQPVFTIKFTFRNYVDRNQRSRSLPPDWRSSRSWLRSFSSHREKTGKERKGWFITVHDLSGSPVAAASMATPFVASPGSEWVSRSNPGCWLILRPGEGTWKPWGRLEAWRERSSGDFLGCRFELIPDNSSNGIVIAENLVSCSQGGKFIVDLGFPGGGGGGRSTPRRSLSPGCSPRGNNGFGSGSGARGFVMSACIEGEGKKGGKPTTVEVSVQHVNCMEDAAAYVALSAAVDLSMDACMLFSQKLRKELCPTRDLMP
ncbi:uncharacterized protein LOC124927482 [Impatiens glandulifera]|uniref:uncharacterized protein LOC124927482 n=1 Tax=Impatiens glandulifera TaxID=253017 RepID=UPI001FB0CDE5|nr:uncharacterized protein LOC124927482 [Impatiens glandulifera]